MKHIDMAKLWLQDEVKSNRLRVRRVKERRQSCGHRDESAQQQYDQKTCDIHGYIGAQKNLSQGYHGLWVANQNKPIRANQLSRKRHWNQLVATPDDSSGSGRVRAPQKRTVADSYGSSHIDFSTNCFVASMRFGVGNGIVVAAEDDDTVSLIADVSMVAAT